MFTQLVNALHITGGELLNGTIGLQNISVMGENNGSILQEWWSLSGGNPITNKNSSDVIIVFYSERVSQPIFSFIAGIG